jgi:MinD superfamily P-loop ATPase
MTELVVVSGKGGTGKTSLAASFAVLAERERGGAVVLADADVDAANLHLVLDPVEREHRPFLGGRLAVIREDDCLRCGGCLAWCRFGAVQREGGGADEATFTVDPLACEGCGVCADHCPAGAVDLVERVGGAWMVADTRYGPLVHARLTPPGENSGKLVTIVRSEARRLAAERGSSLVVVDGPPGLGCPAIAALSGATQVLAVTEPTPSGEHDLARILALAAHFGVPAAVCVNKWDLNPALTAQIERGAEAAGARWVGRIPYDPAVTRAQRAARPVVELDTAAATAGREVWRELGLPRE